MKWTYSQAGIFAALMLAIAVCAVAIGMRPSFGQTTTFYGKNGSYAGTATTHGNQTSFTNERGQFSGSAITHGNSTSFYGRDGHFEGSTIRQGTPSNPLTGGRR